MQSHSSCQNMETFANYVRSLRLSKKITRKFSQGNSLNPFGGQNGKLVNFFVRLMVEIGEVNNINELSLTVMCSFLLLVIFRGGDFNTASQASPECSLVHALYT